MEPDLPDSGQRVFKKPAINKTVSTQVLIPETGLPSREFKKTDNPYPDEIPDSQRLFVKPTMNKTISTQVLIPATQAGGTRDFKKPSLANSGGYGEPPSPQTREFKKPPMASQPVDDLIQPQIIPAREFRKQDLQGGEANIVPPREFRKPPAKVASNASLIPPQFLPEREFKKPADIDPFSSPVEPILRDFKYPYNQSSDDSLDTNPAILPTRGFKKPTEDFKPERSFRREATGSEGNIGSGGALIRPSKITQREFIRNPTPGESSPTGERTFIRNKPEEPRRDRESIVMQVNALPQREFKRGALDSEPTPITPNQPVTRGFSRSLSEPGDKPTVRQFKREFPSEDQTLSQSLSNLSEEPVNEPKPAREFKRTPQPQSTPEEYLKTIKKEDLPAREFKRVEGGLQNPESSAFMRDFQRKQKRDHDRIQTMLMNPDSIQTREFKRMINDAYQANNRQFVRPTPTPTAAPAEPKKDDKAGKDSVKVLIAKYDYVHADTSQSEKFLSFKKGDKFIAAVPFIDAQGWRKVKAVSSGLPGFVPLNYLTEGADQQELDVALQVLKQRAREAAGGGGGDSPLEKIEHVVKDNKETVQQSLAEQERERERVSDKHRINVMNVKARVQKLKQKQSANLKITKPVLMTQKLHVIEASRNDLFGLERIPILKASEPELVNMFQTNEESDLNTVSQSDGYVISGSLAGLVRLFGLVEDFDFISSFLMTHFYFLSSHMLLKALILFFRAPVVPLHFQAEVDTPEGKKKHHHQQRLISVIDTWMALQWEVIHMDASWVQLLLEFIVYLEAGKQPQFKDWALTMTTTWCAVKQRHAEALLPFIPSFRPRPDSGLKLIDVSPSDLAYQLSLFEQTLFQRIPLQDFFGMKWHKEPKKAKNLTFFLKRSNEMVLWVATTIIDSPDKKQMIEHWIHVMEELNLIQNFSSLSQIFDALMLPIFQSLFDDQNFLSDEATIKLSHISNLLNPADRWIAYRRVMDEASPTNPCLAFIPSLLSDLKVYDSHPTYTSEGLINFEKMSLLATVYESVQDFSSRTYSVKEENRSIQDHFYNISFYDSTLLNQATLRDISTHPKQKLSTTPLLQDVIKDKQGLKDFAAFLIQHSQLASNFLAAWLYMSRYKSSFTGGPPIPESNVQAREIISIYLLEKSPKFVGSTYPRLIKTQSENTYLPINCFDVVADELFKQLHSFWSLYWITIE